MESPHRRPVSFAGTLAAGVYYAHMPSEFHVPYCHVSAVDVRFFRAILAAMIGLTLVTGITCLTLLEFAAEAVQVAAR